MRSSGTADCAYAHSKLIIDIYFGLVFQLNGDRKTLVSNLLPGPPPFSEHSQVVLVTIPIDVSRHLECRTLQSACSSHPPAQQVDSNVGNQFGYRSLWLSDKPKCCIELTEFAGGREGFLPPVLTLNAHFDLTICDYCHSST
jgi:hypothetical protein